jgi:hypothetical protein
MYRVKCRVNGRTKSYETASEEEARQAFGELRRNLETGALTGCVSLSERGFLTHYAASEGFVLPASKPVPIWPERWQREAA